MFDFAHWKSFSRKGVVIFSAAASSENDGKCSGEERRDHGDNYADREMTELHTLWHGREAPGI
jgi:hypothetical protein